MMIYRVAAACGVGLEVFEGCTGHHLLSLPVGGGAVAQLGVLFGAAFLLVEGQEGLAKLGHWFRRAYRRLRG